MNKELYKGELKFKFTIDLEEGVSKSIEISSRDRVRDKLNTFCVEHNINNEDKRSLIKTISKMLLEKQYEHYISKRLDVKLDKQEVKKLMEEFNSWKREVEAKVKVNLNKYKTPVINNNSKKIAQKKKLAPIHERFYPIVNKRSDTEKLFIAPHTTRISSPLFSKMKSNSKVNRNLAEVSTANNKVSKYSAVLSCYKRLEGA